MIKPYLDFHQRENLLQNTIIGASLRLYISIKKLRREFHKQMESLINCTEKY